MYFETVDWATSKPSISSSPWMRDAPHFGFSLLIRLIRSTQAPIDLGPPCPLPRFPAPERHETCTMPAKDGLRLNDLCRIQQARPAPGHPDQQGPGTAAQPKARRRAPQGDAELMAEEQGLGFNPARRLEEGNDEHCERRQEREHRSR